MKAEGGSPLGIGSDNYAHIMSSRHDWSVVQRFEGK
jgi:hypothetical protein